MKCVCLCRYQHPYIYWSMHTLHISLSGFTGPLAYWVEYSPMVQETGIQSLVESYQTLKKCYLMSPYLRYKSRVKWCNPWKGVAPSPTPQCSSYWKEDLQVALDYGRQLYFFLYICTTNIYVFILSFILYIYIYIYMEVYIYIYMEVYIYIYIWMHVYIYIYLWMHKDIYIYIPYKPYIYMCMYACMLKKIDKDTCQTFYQSML